MLFRSMILDLVGVYVSYGQAVCDYSCHVISIKQTSGAPQGCVLSSLLYSLFTHDCMAKHDSNTIIKFADDTTVLSLITDNDETAYGKEVRDLAVWVESFKFLGVQITKELSWSKHTKTVVKRARQHLFPLRRLKIFGMGP